MLERDRPLNFKLQYISIYLFDSLGLIILSVTDVKVGVKMICVNRNLDFVTVSQSSFFCLKTMLESASYFTLFEVFDSPDKDVLKDVCWSISNLTTPITGDQIQAVLDAGIVPKLFQLLKVEQPNLQKEAACIVYNAIKYGNPNQVRYLIGEGVILLLSNLLPVSDLEVVTFALGGLETILQLDSKDYNLLETVVEVLCDDGMEAIERLQRHYLDQRISDSVFYTIKEYSTLNLWEAFDF